MELETFIRTVRDSQWPQIIGRVAVSMPRTISGSCMLLIACGMASAQGVVGFENGPDTLISTNSNGGGPPSGLMTGPVGSYYFALYSAPSGTTDPQLFTFTGAYATNTTTPGLLRDSYPATMTNVAPATTVSLLVRGWSANIGSDVTALNAYLANPTFTAWYGESQIGLLEAGDPNDISGAPLVFGTLQFPGLVQIPGFTLGVYPVPEPSGSALAGLTAVLICCRSLARTARWRRWPQW